MNLISRLALLEQLKKYIQSGNESWAEAKDRAFNANGWFIPEFINISVNNIAKEYLADDKLALWIQKHDIPGETLHPKKVGIVMAGNIPLVGFHDMLAVFIAGHYSLIKLSSKDNILIRHLVEKMEEWQPQSKKYFETAATLKGCDAYIATGSNNSSRYFDYYFQKYPHIIRRNRTSIAVLTGNETKNDLEKLADDVHLYFGLGCRNVTKIYVPLDYDFQNLLEALKKFEFFMDHFKYKNNYDYMLSIHLLNQTKYMTNGHVLLVEESSLFSPISQLNYEYYSNPAEVQNSLANNDQLQCIVGLGGIPFGKAQCPGLSDYADGVDTLAFLKTL